MFSMRHLTYATGVNDIYLISRVLFAGLQAGIEDYKLG